jgi:hypothetical protein
MAMNGIKDILITHYSMKIGGSENFESAQFEVTHPLLGTQLLLKSGGCLYLIY